MKLYEEYLKRHSIKIPLVEYCNSGSLILKTKDLSTWSSQWLLMFICWENHHAHPGSFRISIHSANHDSKLSAYKKELEILLKWDEYEDFILNLEVPVAVKWTFNEKTLELVEQLKFVSPVVGEDEATMAIWEMFVFAHDTWFCKQPDRIKNLLYNTLNADLTLKERYENCCGLSSLLSITNPHIYRIWKYDFLGKISDYSHWLAKIWTR
jgi:hypothetical protein